MSGGQRRQTGLSVFEVGRGRYRIVAGFSDRPIGILGGVVLHEYATPEIVGQEIARFARPCGAHVRYLFWTVAVAVGFAMGLLAALML